MNRIVILCAAVGALLAGCGADYAPLVLGKIIPLDLSQGCATAEGADNLYQPQGRLDVAGGGTYVGIVQVTSQLGSTTEVGSLPATEVNNSSANEVIIDTVEVEYESETDLGLEPQKLPYYGVFTPGSGAGGDIANQALINFIPEAVGETLRISLVKGDQIILHAKARISGRTRGGTTVRSNQVDFPIVLTNSGTQCTVFAQTNPCGGVGGQDGLPVTCATP